MTIDQLCEAVSRLRERVERNWQASQDQTEHARWSGTLDEVEDLERQVLEMQRRQTPTP